ncbi:MAG: hypothetical protein JWM95_4410 [Gemmatimonadetes bacterium]|nr:hypothetical protein [Gemmatimonadota bacterium]
MTPTITIALLLVAAPALLVGAIMWRRALLLALPFLVILNGVPLQLGTSLIRIDQLVACLLAMPLALSVIAGERTLRIDTTARWMIAILAMNVAASLAHSPTRGYSLLQCANLASAWIIYLLLTNMVTDAAQLDRLFARCLWAAVAASVLGIGAFVLASAGMPVGGAEVSVRAAETMIRPFGAAGTMLEPNIFGSFMGAMFVFTGAIAAFSLRGAVERRTRLVRWTCALCGLGLLLSFTRSAWIGAIVAILTAVVLGNRLIGSRASQILKPVGVGVAVIAVLLLLPGTTGDFARYKLVNLVNPGSQTALLRILTSTIALQQTLVHPIVGWGTYTFAPLLAEGSDFARFDGWRALWIGNYVLLALHDTGVTGLALWVGMIWSIIANAIRAVRHGAVHSPMLARRTLALVAGVVTLLISFAATTGFSLGYPWLLIGLLALHVRFLQEPAASE